MALHFHREEFDARSHRVRAAMAERGLDALLMFQQESLYYLTGYDTFGFCFFQCLVLTGDGRFALLTRSADLRQARHTSLIEDVRVWTDAAGVEPAAQLRDLLADLGLHGRRLGFESDSYGLTHRNGRAVEAALDGFATLVDASGLVDRLRAVKSPAELACLRRAGELADAALDAALAETRAGADEGMILAAMQGAVFAGGGDYPGNEFIIGSGADALLCRYKSGRRRLDAQDQLTLEFAGVHRHYHAALMRTVVLGTPGARHRAFHAAAREALAACEALLRPGRTAGEVFSAHARVLDAHGLAAHRLAACGYGLGAKFTPSWMDPPMLFVDHGWVLEPGMAMFLHMILMDSDTGTAMCLGRTSIVTGGDPEPVSRASLDLLVR